MTRQAFLAVAATLVLTRLAGGQASGAKAEVLPKKGEVIVEGVLLNPDKSVAPGKDVFILESTKKGTFKLAVEPTGAICNQATTDKKGRFQVRVDRAFLESRQAVLCVLLPNGITPQYPNDRPLVVRPPEGKNVVDLGEVTITDK